MIVSESESKSESQVGLKIEEVEYLRLRARSAYSGGVDSALEMCKATHFSLSITRGRAWKIALVSAGRKDL